MVGFHRRIGPSNELPPGQALACELRGAVGEPRSAVDRDPVVVERLNVMIVVGGDDLQLGVVIDVSDGDVEAIAAEAAVALAVPVRIVPLTAAVVVARPCWLMAVVWLVAAPVRVENEHLRAAVRGAGGLRRRRYDFDPPVLVEVRGGQTPNLG